MTLIVDTHCHIDAYNDPLAVLDEARAAGIRVVAVTEDPGKYRVLRTRLGRRHGVDVALGFVFDAILADPQLQGRPVTIHSRGAERETIMRLAQTQLRAILHWYTGHSLLSMMRLPLGSGSRSTRR